VVLAAMTFAMHDRIAAVISVGLLGAAAFATVPPLQMWVLERAAGAGQSLASSLNIAAFNLGNAAGALLGGLVIDYGPGLGSITLIAALAPLAALAVVLWSRQLELRQLQTVAAPGE
jgi:MFS transporter, DHA1 family, inner membrane transport protein